MKATLEKLREKLIESLQAVLPIVCIVLILCFSIAPISPSILLCFLMGAVMIVLGLLMRKPKLKWLGDYALPISLILGMVSAIPITALLG